MYLKTTLKKQSKHKSQELKLDFLAEN